MIALMLAAGLALPQAAGDFDRDGRPDLARLEPRERGYALVVQRAAAQEPDVILHLNDAAGVWLGLQPRGKRPTICAKDVGPRCRPGERRQVKVRDEDVLAFGIDEGFAGVALWTGEKFEVEYLAD